MPVLRAGPRATVGFDLNDPTPDGKLHVGEIPLADEPRSHVPVRGRWRVDRVSACVCGDQLGVFRYRL